MSDDTENQADQAREKTTAETANAKIESMSIEGKIALFRTVIVEHVKADTKAGKTPAERVIIATLAEAAIDVIAGFFIDMHRIADALDEIVKIEREWSAEIKREKGL
jgi:hypothetical protein